MKHLIVTALMACPLTTLVPQAVCQDTKPEQLHLLMGTPQGHRVELTATSMERDVSSKETQLTLHLKGNVAIRLITCVPTGKENACEGAMILRADEAEYHQDTGEFEARGNVHVIPHLPAQAK